MTSLRIYLVFTVLAACAAGAAVAAPVTGGGTYRFIVDDEPVTNTNWRCRLVPAYGGGFTQLCWGHGNTGNGAGDSDGIDTVTDIVLREGRP